jgi:hypothetical protein
MSVSTEQNSANQVTITQDGETASITTGGNGRTGTVVLKNSFGKAIVTVGHTGGGLPIEVVGSAGAVYIANPDGQETIRLNGAVADILAGGNGQDGTFILFDSKRQETIRLSGGAAQILTGGNGQNGTLVLFDSNRVEAIRLRTGNNDNGIYVFDHAGKVVLNFASEANMTGKPAGLWLGRAKADGGGPGLLVVRDATGSDSIVIDGAKGDIILANGDCAEDFDISASAEADPGTVMVIDQENRLRPSTDPYDKKVAGVISGAGDCKPGIILDKKQSQSRRLPVALVGKVYCKADAEYSPIEVGDLLTTSSTPGHAMKATEPSKGLGCLIGKALHPLKEGQGLIPILVALQ